MKPNENARSEWYEGDDSVFTLAADDGGAAKPAQKRRIPGQGVFGWVVALWKLAHGIDRR